MEPRGPLKTSTLSLRLPRNSWGTFVESLPLNSSTRQAKVDLIIRKTRPFSEEEFRAADNGLSWRACHFLWQVRRRRPFRARMVKACAVSKTDRRPCWNTDTVLGSLDRSCLEIWVRGLELR